MKLSMVIPVFDESATIRDVVERVRAVPLETEIIIVDDDLEYEPREYARLLRPIVDGHADVVYGSLFTGGECHRVLYFSHGVGNQPSDAAGERKFRREVISSIRIEENRFGFEPEVTGKISAMGCRVYEVGAVPQQLPPTHLTTVQPTRAGLAHPSRVPHRV